MSTRISGSESDHQIVAAQTSGQLDNAPYGRFSYLARHPHLWYQGDRVAILSADGKHYAGLVVDVSRVTSAVLIEMESDG